VGAARTAPRRKGAPQRERRPAVGSRPEVNTVQPSSPIVFVAAFLIALVALAAELIPLAARLTEVTAPA